MGPTEARRPRVAVWVVDEHATPLTPAEGRFLWPEEPSLLAEPLPIRRSRPAALVNSSGHDGAAPVRAGFTQRNRRTRVPI